MRSRQIAIVGSSTTPAFVVVPIARAASESWRAGSVLRAGGSAGKSKRKLTAVLPASHRR
jgi:hypothetical protein